VGNRADRERKVSSKRFKTDFARQDKLFTRLSLAEATKETVECRDNSEKSPLEVDSSFEGTKDADESPRFVQKMFTLRNIVRVHYIIIKVNFATSSLDHLRNPHVSEPKEPASSRVLRTFVPSYLRGSPQFLDKEREAKKPSHDPRESCTAERSHLFALGSTMRIPGHESGLSLSSRQERATRQVGPRAPVKRDKLGIRRRGKRGPALTFPSRYTAYGTAGDPVDGPAARSAGKVEEGSEVEFARADERERRQPERSLRREEMIANRGNPTVFKARLCDQETLTFR